MGDAMTLSLNPMIDEPETVFDLASDEMLNLISSAKPLFEREKNLLEASRETILVVGDTHGNFEGTTSIVALWKEQGCDKVVFLGDYVDRGEQPLETLNFLLVLKLLYPEKVFLLRGNHETLYMNSRYGFLSYCTRKFGKEAESLHTAYNVLFSYFSPAFLLSEKILLLHGGVPDKLSNLKDINSLPKGDLDADNEILGQILWNDPSEECQGFEHNSERGFHYLFGENVFLKFLEQHNLAMVIRGHQIFPEGYKYFFDQKLLSIFSSPGYRGSKAKIAEISENGDVHLISVYVK